MREEDESNIRWGMSDTEQFVKDKMTDTELNRAVCEKLGIHFYEAYQKDRQLFTSPDFTQNAKVLLEAVKDKLSLTDWYTFHRSVGGGIKKEYIYLTYILNPRQLCEKFLEFMELNKGE